MKTWYWFQSVLTPGEGWSLIRWTKRGTLFAVPEVLYTRLMMAELVDVIDLESTALLLDVAQRAEI